LRKGKLTLLKKVRAGFRKYFIAGLLVVAPLYLSYYIVSILVVFADRIITFLPEKFHPDTYLPFHIPGLGVIITFLFLLIVGVLATNLFGRKLLHWWERILARIPLIRTVYTGTKQFIETFFITNRGGFSRVVLIEYPRKGIFSVGFVTGPGRGEIQMLTQRKVLNIFLPTTPNPTSGWYMLVPEEDTIPLKMSVEEAFKLIISGGIVSPENAEAMRLDSRSTENE
jgi:uncharacterized membrane protein